MGSGWISGCQGQARVCFSTVGSGEAFLNDKNERARETARIATTGNFRANLRPKGSSVSVSVDLMGGKHRRAAGSPAR